MLTCDTEIDKLSWTKITSMVEMAAVAAAAAARIQRNFVRPLKSIYEKKFPYYHYLNQKHEGKWKKDVKVSFRSYHSVLEVIGIHWNWKPMMGRIWWRARSCCTTDVWYICTKYILAHTLKEANKFKFCLSKRISVAAIFSPSRRVVAFAYEIAHTHTHRPNSLCPWH